MKRYLFILTPMFLLTLFGSLSWQSCNSTKVVPDETATAAPQGTVEEAAALADLREKIKGREQEPAEDVFENIQIMKGFPAGRVLGIMQMAFNRSLGVSCDHCHVPNSWASEDKRAKQIAREMWIMTGKINRELLTDIPNLRSKIPVANCTTCHRGQIIPATSLE